MTTDNQSPTQADELIAKLAAQVDDMLADRAAEWLSTADLARLLGKSVIQIRNMRYLGLLPEARKVPGLGLRWTRSSIVSYLDNPVSIRKQT